MLRTEKLQAIADPDLALAAMRELNSFVYRFEPLSPTEAFYLRVSRVKLKTFTLSFIETSGFTICGPSPEVLTISVPLRGGQSFEAADGRRLEAGTEPAILGPDDCSWTTTRNFIGLGLAIPRSELSAIFAANQVSMPLQLAGGFVAGTDGNLTFLRKAMVSAADLLDTLTPGQIPPDEYMHALERLLGSALALCFAEDRAGEVRPNYARLAATYIENNYRNSLTLHEIAAVAGCGVRSLEIAFQKTFKTTVKTYLQNVRLEAVHERLRAAETRLVVSRVARECGFTHMPRFGLAYRRRYGEYPTDTISDKLWQQGLDQYAE